MKLTINRAGGALALTATLVIAGCGGGGSSSSTSPPTPPPPNNGGGISGTGSPMSASGPITVSGTGAVSINGVALSTSNATVRIDDRTGTLADVKDGVTGKVRGRINDDRLTGTAETIEIENEVRGPAASVDAAATPQTFTVNGQKVYVDSQTVYANLAPAGFAGISANTYVEVHGLRDNAGSIRATRIEGKTAIAGDDEVRGTVSAVQAAGSTFTLGVAPNAIAVNYAAATFTGGSAASLAPNVLVEVHGAYNGTTFVATRIDFEDVEDSSLAPSATDDAEVEGYVSGFTSLSGTFKVGARTVAVSSATRYEGGTSADLANDVRVEAEGNVNSSGVLVAGKVQFKAARIVLQGVPSAVGTTTFVVLGKTVNVTSLTKIDTRTAGGASSTSLSDIAVGSDCVEVKARLDGASLVADEVKEQGNGSCKAIVQARVTAENETARTLTMLGIDVNLSGGAVVFRDAGGTAISATQFFAAVNPTAGTLVKAKGSFSGANLLTGEEAELEN